MARNRDPLVLTPHWHVDCRLEAELPEDNVVGTRFMVGAAFGTVAMAMLLFVGWLGYTRTRLRAEIDDWDHRISENRTTVQEIERAQLQYTAEANKIEKAANLIKTPLLCSEFIANLAKILPQTMALTAVEWNESGIVATGTAPPSDELKNFVASLKRSPKFSDLFSDIKQAAFDPVRGEEDLYKFEVKFILRTAP